MEYGNEEYSLKSGVYKITNKINGRIYIGSAKEFKRRCNQHRIGLIKKKHTNKFLQADFNKCGEDAFVFEVIEVVEGPQENRLLIEQTYIKNYYDDQDQCYNLSPYVNKRGAKCRSYNPQQTLERFRAATKGKPMWTEEEKKSISERLRGHKVSEVTRQKLRNAMIGKKLSEETRRKIAEGNKGKHRDHLASMHKVAIEASAVARKGKSAWNKGRKCTEQEKKEMSDRQKSYYLANPEKMQKLKGWNKGKKQSEETINKRSRSLSKSIKAIELKTLIETTFDSIGAAIATLKISETSIYRNLDGKAESVKGYKFEMLVPRRKMRKV